MTKSVRGSRRRLLPMLLLLACATASASAIATASASADPNSGVNGWTVSQLGAPRRDLQLATMRAEGVQLVRSDAPWSEIQPRPPGPTGPGWRFARTDAWVEALAAHGLTWQPVLDFSAWWAKRCPGMCAPASDSTYAAFARAVAARYGPGGSFWGGHPRLPYRPATVFEIWNEENVAASWVNPARFARLYLAARAAIHAVAPSASAIVGGLADDSSRYELGRDYPARYVLGMFASDPALVGNVDGFGLHPYGATATDVQSWTVDFRHTLQTLGEGAAPIYITELGWTTGSAPRELWRARMMGAVADSLSRSDCGIRLLEPYDWMGPAEQNADFGLVDDPTGRDARLREAGSAWFRALADAPSLPRLSLCG